jgi:hypothetical protein
VKVDEDGEAGWTRKLTDIFLPNFMAGKKMR